MIRWYMVAFGVKKKLNYDGPNLEVTLFDLFPHTD